MFDRGTFERAWPVTFEFNPKPLFEKRPSRASETVYIVATDYADCRTKAEALEKKLGLNYDHVTFMIQGGASDYKLLLRMI